MYFYGVEEIVPAKQEGLLVLTVRLGCPVCKQDQLVDSVMSLGLKHAIADLQCPRICTNCGVPSTMPERSASELASAVETKLDLEIVLDLEEQTEQSGEPIRT